MKKHLCIQITIEISNRNEISDNGIIKITTLEKSTKSIRDLLRGKKIELGAVKPSHLPHHRPVPVWIAAAGQVFFTLSLAVFSIRFIVLLIGIIITFFLGP